MAGYSTTSLAKKLGIKPDFRVWLDAAPDTWTIPDLPEHVALFNEEIDSPDVIVSFFRERNELHDVIDILAKAIFPDGCLWAAWPRKAGGHMSDISESTIRETALPIGLVDTKVAALDDDWSALKLTWRKELRD